MGAEITEEQLLKALGELDTLAKAQDDEESEEEESDEGSEDEGDDTEKGGFVMPKSAPPKPPSPPPGMKMGPKKKLMGKGGSMRGAPPNPPSPPPGMKMGPKKKLVKKSDSDEGELHGHNQDGLPDDIEEANGGFSGAEDIGGTEEYNQEDWGVEAEEGEEATMKSLVDQNADLRKGFEVSGFLEALVETTTASVDNLAKSLGEQMADQRRFNSKLAKALLLVGRELVQVRNAVDDAPVARPRSVMQKSEVQERFESSGRSQYTKEQALAAMVHLAEQDKVPALAVAQYESTGTLDPTYQGLVNGALKQMYG